VFIQKLPSNVRETHVSFPNKEGKNAGFVYEPTDVSEEIISHNFRFGE
jgi:hypothetical protein